MHNTCSKHSLNIASSPVLYRREPTDLEKMRLGDDGHPLGPEVVRALERSWHAKRPADAICPRIGRARTITVNVDTGEGSLVVHVCQNKKCPACGERWREMKSIHYRRMMDGHAIYWREVGPEENWRTVTTGLTRQGHLWHAPMAEDGSRMLFSTCPDQGRSLPVDMIDALLDPRCPSLGMGGRWNSCRAWSFERGVEESASAEQYDSYAEPNAVEDDSSVVILEFQGTVTEVIDAAHALGIKVELKGATVAFHGIPKEGSPEWWDWQIRAKAYYLSHRQAHARLKALKDSARTEDPRSRAEP